jgi:hypothetical protein
MNIAVDQMEDGELSLPAAMVKAMILGVAGALFGFFSFTALTILTLLAWWGVSGSHPGFAIAYRVVGVIGAVVGLIAGFGISIYRDTHAR